jgi:hypothetical protein
VGYLCGCFHPTGPYTQLVPQGQMGTAKTTLGEFVKQLIDPGDAGLRRPPRNEHDMAIAASNSWLLAYDNVSKIDEWLADALCRIATGAGLGLRTLYTDEDETTFHARRPVLITSIKDVVVRPDHQQRCVFIQLSYISQKKRRPAQEMEDAFAEAHPRLLGAMLDAVVGGLRVLPQIKLGKLPDQQFQRELPGPRRLRCRDRPAAVDRQAGRS